MPFIVAAVWGAAASFISWSVSVITRIFSRGFLLLSVFVSLLYFIFQSLMSALSGVVFDILPYDYSGLIKSILPGHFSALVSVIMTTRIMVFIYDFKDRFIQYAGRIF